jgi:hypothetical protein
VLSISPGANRRGPRPGKDRGPTHSVTLARSQSALRGEPRAYAIKPFGLLTVPLGPLGHAWLALVPPKSLEPSLRQGRVPGCVLDICVAEVMRLPSSTFRIDAFQQHVSDVDCGSDAVWHRLWWERERLPLHDRERPDASQVAFWL